MNSGLETRTTRVRRHRPPAGDRPTPIESTGAAVDVQMLADESVVSHNSAVVIGHGDPRGTLRMIPELPAPPRQRLRLSEDFLKERRDLALVAIPIVPDRRRL